MVHETDSKMEIVHVEGLAASETHNETHRAALEDSPETAERLSTSSTFAVFFLGLSFVGPVGVGFLLITAILVPIGQALGDTSTIAWVPGGWSIASSVSFSIAGALSDIFGRRILILTGQVIVVIGAIVAATAMAMTSVIAGSTLIGFGCGFIFVAYAGIPELLPNKYRGVGLGFTEFCLNIPWGACSALLANLFVDRASWRWCYYITIIYGVISLAGTAIFYFPPSRPREDYEKTRWQEIKELDFIGITLYTTGLTVLLIGLTWAGTRAHPWGGVSVIAPIVIGAVTLIACFVYDFHFAKQPLFPPRLFARVREFSVLLIVITVSGMIFYSMSSLLPQATLYIFTSDGIQIGLILLPAGIGSLVGGWLMPSLLQWTKHIRLQIIIGLVLQTLFVGLYIIAVPNNKAAWMAFLFFGQGCFTWITALCYVSTGLHVPQKELGLASGLLGTFRSAGGSVGNAIFSTILTTVTSSTLTSRITTAALDAGFPSDQLSVLIPAVSNNAVGVPGAFMHIPDATMAVQAATSVAFKEAYAHSFTMVFYATIPFGVIAIIAALFIKDPSIYLTNHVAIHMEKEILVGKQQGDDEK